MVERRDKGTVPLDVTAQPAFARAVRLVHGVCCLAGEPSFVEEIREHDVQLAIARHDTAAVFDWLVQVLSFQGISNQLAADYMARHGSATWTELTANLAAEPSCPKLSSFWHFSSCRYDKTSQTCSEPEHFDACPLPRHNLRNGHLNQLAYSLYLFIRDVAGGDLVGWIEAQITADAEPGHLDASLALERLVGPLRGVYGAADKVLLLALSPILLGRADRSNSKSISRLLKKELRVFDLLRPNLNR